MLCETIKHLSKEHIGAFYKTANGKFVIVLKEVELKDLCSHEINFKGKIGDAEHFFKILPLPPSGGNERRKKNFINAVSVTMFLPTTLSDTAIKKSFLEFGEVHVFAGKFKKPYNNISTNKGHIRITPYKSYYDTSPPMKFFFDDSRPFQVMWAEKKVSCKKCICVHMLRDNCHPAPDSLTPSDNGDIALTSMISGGERVTT